MSEVGSENSDSDGGIEVDVDEDIGLERLEQKLEDSNEESDEIEPFEDPIDADDQFWDDDFFGGDLSPAAEPATKSTSFRIRTAIGDRVTVNNRQEVKNRKQSLL